MHHYQLQTRMLLALLLLSLHSFMTFWSCGARSLLRRTQCGAGGETQCLARACSIVGRFECVQSYDVSQVVIERRFTHKRPLVHRA